MHKNSINFIDEMLRLIWNDIIILFFSVAIAITSVPILRLLPLKIDYIFYGLRNDFVIWWIYICGMGVL